MGRVLFNAGIDEDAQRGSFQNATLQTAGSLAVSIATEVQLPRAVAAHGGRAIAMLLVTELSAAVQAAPEVSFDVQVELKGSAAQADAAPMQPQRVASPKGVSLLLGVSEDDQRTSFENATLQGSGVAAFSIATHVKVPTDIADRGDEAVNRYIHDALSKAVQASPALSFDVQSGLSHEAALADGGSVAGAKRSGPAL